MCIRDRKNTEIAPRDFVVFDQLLKHEPSCCTGHGKANPLKRFSEDRSIDSDDAALGVYQRPSTIAGVYRGDSLEQALLFMLWITGTIFAAENSRGDRLLKAVRAADRPDDRTNINIVTFTPRGGNQFWGFNFQDREIADRISACLLYTSPSPRDRQKSRMPSSA